MNITQAQSESDLKQILELQRINLPSNLSGEEIQKEGFVTVHHRLEDLRKMNLEEQHVIAKDHDRVVAYLLAMTDNTKKDIPVLAPMFELFTAIDYRGKKISDYRYLVVGQVCVAKEYRGIGLIDQCYAHYKKVFSSKYEMAITEIDNTNQRSLKAHARIGFETVHRYIDHFGKDWHVVLWDWTN